MAIKKKYNFKGLDEIFGESVADLVSDLEDNPNKSKEIAKTISIEKLIPNPFQPRQNFNEEELLELSNSISIHGIIQPIVVNQKEDIFQIVAGERRYRAAKIAGLKEVPVNILNLSNEQMEEFAIIENIQRVDLTDIEEAIAYKQLSTNLKLKQEEIATKVGKSRSHVANIMRLLNLPEHIQKAMLDGLVTMGQTKPLLTISSNPELMNLIFEKILKNNLTARQVEDMIKNYNKDSKIVTDVVKNPDVIRVENTLMKKFGTKIVIDNNKIVIKYSGEHDLNRILEILEIEYEN